MIVFSFQMFGPSPAAFPKLPTFIFDGWEGREINIFRLGRRCDKFIRSKIGIRTHRIPPGYSGRLAGNVHCSAKTRHIMIALDEFIASIAICILFVRAKSLATNHIYLHNHTKMRIPSV